MQAKSIVEIFHKVLGKLVCTYSTQGTCVDDADLCMGNIASAFFVVQSMYHIIKDKNPVKMIFGWDTILPIKHVADWRYIRQNKQAQIEKDIICKNSTKIDYDYIVGDQFILSYKSSYKYKTPFKYP